MTLAEVFSQHTHAMRWERGEKWVAVRDCPRNSNRSVGAKTMDLQPLQYEDPRHTDWQPCTEGWTKPG